MLMVKCDGCGNEESVNNIQKWPKLGIRICITIGVVPVCEAHVCSTKCYDIVIDKIKNEGKKEFEKMLHR